MVGSEAGDRVNVGDVQIATDGLSAIFDHITGVGSTDRGTIIGAMDGKANVFGSAVKSCDGKGDDLGFGCSQVLHRAVGNGVGISAKAVDGQAAKITNCAAYDGTETGCIINIGN